MIRRRLTRSKPLVRRRSLGRSGHAPEPGEAEVRQALASVDRCEACGRKDRPLSPHHVIPVSRGGPWALWNVLVVCDGPGDGETVPCHKRCQQYEIPEAVQFALVWAREATNPRLWTALLSFSWSRLRGVTTEYEAWWRSQKVGARIGGGAP